MSLLASFFSLRERLYRTILCFAIAAAAALAPSTPAIAFPAPSEEGIRAYYLGQGYARLFQDYLEPGACGVVLERVQCNEDWRQVRALRGPDSTDAFMEQWLATGDRSLWKDQWNGMEVPESAWKADPVFAWWYTAGVASIVASVPQIPASNEYAASIASLFVKHPSASPAAFQASVPTSATGLASLKPLQASLEQLFVVQPYPPVNFGIGLTEDARLGIYLTTLAELVDNPLALSRPESRAFGVTILRRAQQVNQQFGRSISTDGVAQILMGEVPSDAAAINATLREPLAGFGATPAWPDAARKAFAVGFLTAQIAYNAAVLKDPKWDRLFRAVLGSLPMYDGIPADASSALKKLASLPAEDWTQINATATAAALAIASPQSGGP